MDKVIPQLFNQIQSVTDQNESRVYNGSVCNNTLHEHDHCQGLTATLCMPNNAATAGASIFTVDAAHRIFNAKELLIAGNLLNAAIIQNKETNHVQQTLPGQHGNDYLVLLGNVAIVHIALCGLFLPLHILFMPLAVKLLPGSGSTVLDRFRIQGNSQLRELKQLGDVVRLPVADVLLHTIFHIHAGFFTFDHNQRDAVDQQDNVRPGIFAVGAFYGKFIRNLPDIVLGVFPVNIGNVEGLGIAVIQMHITTFAVNQPIIDRLAGEHQATLQRRIQLTDRFADGIIGEWSLLSSVNKGLRSQKLPHHIREQYMRQMAALLLSLCSGNILIAHGLQFPQRSILGFRTLIKNLMTRHSEYLRPI